MTSSMVTGERRWASARRGGMTVLGKVAVPKPINLPSQRSENHGNPNVEIVPKGTHSWGTRSSSSTPNAWGTSMLSPNTDGGSSSPSHLSGRPSSGGSGTRPSTASSDRTHEPVANAWGSNSRPSSASGALTSSQTSLVSLRPRSAETRPASSQLSRFAEPLSDNDAAWGATGVAEKLGSSRSLSKSLGGGPSIEGKIANAAFKGMTSSKNDGFSLTSGDFPTLGSEKESLGKKMESRDYGSHSRPDSSTGGEAPGKEITGNSSGDAFMNNNAKPESANYWRRENLVYGEDGPRPSMEKWHPDLQLYPNSNIHSQNYDSWRPPPLNNHLGGIWYRGPPGGPPFPPPIAPGGFPMEPFPYYRPQIPPAALANPQQGPPPGPRPRGPHLKNGDMYRAHMHDAYIRPSMPFGPGFYPGPVPYEGYYGPPVSYCNSNERDIQFMGMAVGPAPYNRYSGQNAPDCGNSLGRSGGYGPSGHQMVSELVETGHPQEAQGPYKVLLKQHDGSEGKNEEQKWDDMMATNAPYYGNVDHQRNSSLENGWSADDKSNEERDTRTMALGEKSSSEVTDNLEVLKVKSLEHMGNSKAVDDNLVKKSGQATSGLPESSEAPKEPSLIRKLEGLNAKTRAYDARQDLKFVPSREEQKNNVEVGYAKSNHSANEAGTRNISLEKTHVSGIIDTGSSEDHISGVGKILEVTDDSGTASSRRSTYHVHGRHDHRGKERFRIQEADGSRRRTQAAESSSVLSSSQLESSNVHRQDHSSAEATEKSGGSYQWKDDGKPMPPIPDPRDSQKQRAKMKELASQRFKQREKEEEERLRDQKAKAFAKLEELNKRSKATVSSTQKSESIPGSGIQDKQEKCPQPTGLDSKSRAASTALGCNQNEVAENRTNRVENSTSLSTEALAEIPEANRKDSVVIQEQFELSQQDVGCADAYHHDAPHILDSRASKQKHVSYRQKQNGPLIETPNEEPMSYMSEIPKHATDVAANASTSLKGEIASNSAMTLPANPNTMAEPSLHHRRKSRTGKNKHKLEEASSIAVVPPITSKETTALDISVESSKLRASDSLLDQSSFQSQTDSRDGNQSPDQRTSSPVEEAHGRVNNQWKPHHSRRTLRNPQANKSTEKFHSGDAVVWAPVRPQNKIKASDEGSQKSATDAKSIPPVSIDQQGLNNQKNKRAEMERYIPKPVAKEMAQQGSSPHLVVPLANQITPDETVGRTESVSLGSEGSQSSATGIGKVVSTFESKTVDGRQNKSGKLHGSWRQRGLAESTISWTSRNVQKSIEHQVQKTDASSAREQLNHSDEWNASDGWNIPENSDGPVTAPAIKDQGAPARGRRQSYWGQKGMGYNHDLDEKRINSGDTEKVYVQTSVPEMHEADSHAISKENRAVGERPASQWQPKSQPSSTTIRGSRTNVGQNTGSEVVRGNRKDSTSLTGMPLLPQLGKEIAAVKAQPQPDPTPFEMSNLEQAPSTGHQGGKKDRKTASHKRSPGSPAEPSTLNMDFQQEQTLSSGFCKNGNQNSRFGREHDSRGDWSGSWKDNKQHNASANRERQRQNTHYEYQPVGPQNNSKSNNFESPKDGSHNSVAKTRERGQSHSRSGGGSFYGRQTGSVSVGSNYD